MILAFLKSLPLRLFAVTLLAGMLVFVGWSLYNKIWTAGYTQAQFEIQGETLRAVDQAVAQARARWESAARAARKELKLEKEIEENIREIEKQIPEAVGSVDPACRDLGERVLGLFNSAAEAANNSLPRNSGNPP